MTTPRAAPTSSAEAAARVVDQLTTYAVIALDTEGRIVSWNPGARLLKGYEAQDAIGRHFSMFYNDEDRASGLPQQLLEAARTTGTALHSGPRVRQDGSEFWADVVITALHDDGGRLTGYAKVTRDLTDQHELELELRRSEERFRTLVEQVVDYAIIGLDADGVIVTWNAGAQRLKHYSVDEAVGAHFSMFYPPEDVAAGLPERLLQQARDDGHVEHTGWRLRRDGSRFWGNVVVTAIHDDHDTVTGFAKVTRDLTSVRRFEEARESFFRSFAHDFRAPVAAIAGFSELVGSVPPDRAAGLVERIATNARRLVAMTNDLVEHTRLATLTMSVPTPERLGAVVGDVVRSLPDPTASDRVDIAVEDAEVMVDRAALERVLVNLLSNALKYSPGSSTVTVAGTVRGERARIVVADHGRGIHELDLPHIFDEFQRGRLSEDDGGFGLGLASVRRLVDQMGGTIDIASRVGVGTTVTLDLPVAGP